MYKIKEAIIVEGTYDEIKLSGFLDAVIIKTNGFSVIKDKKKLETIKTLAKKMGICILTDSDTAGFRIRSFIRQFVGDAEVKNAYIPDISGKERRKNQPSKEGLLGVEGVSEDVILKALLDAGCEIDGKVLKNADADKITKTDLYLLGLSGGENSVLLRKLLCDKLELPAKISANMLVSVLNRLMSKQQLDDLVSSLEY